MRTVNGVILTASTDSVRAAHLARKSNNHFFDGSTLSFFKSRIGSRLYGHRYFTTSEQGPSGVRTYTVRELSDDGSIETVGEFEHYTTSNAANRAAQKLADAAAGKTVQKSTRVTVYVVQGAYGQGWEDVNEEATRADGRRSLREYQDNASGYPHRLITRRVVRD